MLLSVFRYACSLGYETFIILSRAGVQPSLSTQKFQLYYVRSSKQLCWIAMSGFCLIWKRLLNNHRRTRGVYAEVFFRKSLNVEKWGRSMKCKACEHLPLWLIKVLSVWRMFVRNDFLKPPCCLRTMKLHVTSDKAERPLGSCSPSVPHLLYLTLFVLRYEWSVWQMPRETCLCVTGNAPWEGFPVKIVSKNIAQPCCRPMIRLIFFF